MSITTPFGSETRLVIRFRRKALIFPYVLMIAAWMLDFRSEGAGRGLGVQIYFLLCHTVFFCLFLMMDRAARVKIRGLSPFAICTILYIGVAVTSGMLRGQDFYLIFRNALPVLIYLTAAYATARMVVTNSVVALRHALGWLCLGFAISSFFIVLFFQGGVDVETIRYQIQGTSSVAALGLIVLAPALGLLGVEMIAGLSTVLVIFLTITRTYFVVLLGQGLLLLPVFRRLMHPRLAVVLIVGVLVSALLLVYGGESADRWLQRLFISEQFGGSDPTYMTRYLEWSYMWDEFFSSFDKFLFGSGLAAKTFFLLPVELGGSGSDHGSIGFGHNQHLSLLFTAGLIGGAPLLFFQFLQGWQGFRFLAPVARRYTRKEPCVVFLGAWGGTIVLGTVAMNIFSCAFVVRGFSLWYGIGTGLLLGARTLLMARKITKDFQR